MDQKVGKLTAMVDLTRHLDIKGLGGRGVRVKGHPFLAKDKLMKMSPVTSVLHVTSQ